MDNQEQTLKQTLRTEARRVRDRIDALTDNPEDAARHFLETIPFEKNHIVAGYWPKGREFDPRPVMDDLMQEGHVCALPVVQENSKILKFARWEDSMELVAGAFGTLQPADTDTTEWVEPDIIIVPMLAFDRKGNRLGQGGGYYDATLKALRKKKSIMAVGMAYAQQACLFKLPTESHDEKLDWIVTSGGATRFQEPA